MGGGQILGHVGMEAKPILAWGATSCGLLGFGGLDDSRFDRCANEATRQSLFKHTTLYISCQALCSVFHMILWYRFLSPKIGILNLSLETECAQGVVHRHHKTLSLDRSHPKLLLELYLISRLQRSIRLEEMAACFLWHHISAPFTSLLPWCSD